jgi:hypothetical protein
LFFCFCSKWRRWQHKRVVTFFFSFCFLLRSFSFFLFETKKTTIASLLPLPPPFFFYLKWKWATIINLLLPHFFPFVVVVMNKAMVTNLLLSPILFLSTWSENGRQQ